MSVDIVATCEAASSSQETPVLAITLASLFAVYVLLDSLLAMSAIVRKSAEAEALSARTGIA
ncbi:MAG: hypothetical protein CMI16_12950 [Opitutaceae bacterium]|nr:hypothetical protein [Opitutaceae bacterium]|tara:strand:+ start:720 stop:905 length:186 start_codon:yes stop_codon:yes gene_type:complete